MAVQVSTMRLTSSTSPSTHARPPSSIMPTPQFPIIMATLPAPARMPGTASAHRMDGLRLMRLADFERRVTADYAAGGVDFGGGSGIARVFVGSRAGAATCTDAAGPTPTSGPAEYTVDEELPQGLPSQNAPISMQPSKAIAMGPKSTQSTTSPRMETLLAAIDRCSILRRRGACQEYQVPGETGGDHAHVLGTPIQHPRLLPGACRHRNPGLKY